VTEESGTSSTEQHNSTSKCWSSYRTVSLSVNTLLITDRRHLCSATRRQ